MNRLNIPAKQKAEMAKRQARTDVDTLSNKEVVDVAKSAGIDTKSRTIDETKQVIADQLNVRNVVVKLNNQLSSMKKSGAKPNDILAKIKEIDGYSRLSTEQGTDIARQLQARNILANALDTPMQRVFKLLQNAGVNPDEYTKKAVDVNFYDSEQVTAFYRNLVPAKAQIGLISCDIIQCFPVLSHI
jgi:hypothetical protein